MFEPCFILLRAGRTLVGGWVSVKMKWAEVGDGKVGFQGQARAMSSWATLWASSKGRIGGPHGRRGVNALTGAKSRRLKKWIEMSRCWFAKASMGKHLLNRSRAALPVARRVEAVDADI